MDTKYYRQFATILSINKTTGVNWISFIRFLCLKASSVVGEAFSFE